MLWAISGEAELDSAWTGEGAVPTWSVPGAKTCPALNCRLWLRSATCDL